MHLNPLHLTLAEYVKGCSATELSSDTQDRLSRHQEETVLDFALTLSEADFYACGSVHEYMLITGTGDATTCPMRSWNTCCKHAGIVEDSTYKTEYGVRTPDNNNAAAYLDDAWHFLKAMGVHASDELRTAAIDVLTNDFVTIDDDAYYRWRRTFQGHQGPSRPPCVPLFVEEEIKHASTWSAYTDNVRTTFMNHLFRAG